jgi:putative solute:sodium symporter small subunit
MSSSPVAVPAAVRRARVRHWHRTLGLTAALLLAWFVVGFVVTWYARDLDFPFFGWPFSFWVAAQGGITVFVLRLGAHARGWARNDRRLASETGVGDEASGTAR